MADMPSLEVESDRAGTHLYLNSSQEQLSHGHGGDFLSCIIFKISFLFLYEPDDLKGEGAGCY